MNAPTPWHRESAPCLPTEIYADKCPVPIGEMASKELAAQVIRAVNAHDGLVKALTKAERILSILDRTGHIPAGGESAGNLLDIGDGLDAAREALAAAKGR